LEAAEQALAELGWELKEVETDKEYEPKCGFKYKNDRYNLFVKEIEKAIEDLDIEGELRDYKGRMFYHGPAIECDSIDEITRYTTCRCNWDNLGKGYIVYPS
jgi:hypothetical protein